MARGGATRGRKEAIRAVFLLYVLIIREGFVAGGVHNDERILQNNVEHLVASKIWEHAIPCH